MGHGTSMWGDVMGYGGQLERGWDGLGHHWPPQSMWGHAVVQPSSLDLLPFPLLHAPALCRPPATHKFVQLLRLPSSGGIGPVSELPSRLLQGHQSRGGRTGVSTVGEVLHSMPERPCLPPSVCVHCTMAMMAG